MSCLFNSLSKFVSDDSGTIRRKICDYLETNPIIFDDAKAEDVINWESNTSLSSYVLRMRNTSTWGGAIEIRCFCNIYNLNVEVINIRGGNRNEKSIFFPKSFNSEDNKETLENIVKISWNGGHYEPIS